MHLNNMKKFLQIEKISMDKVQESEEEEEEEEGGQDEKSLN
jgi:hypothetical protein